MYTLIQETVYEEEIKKSRFIARAIPADTPQAALAYLERVRDARATHHCWAYQIGESYRFSDDGEPAGTAGKPILNAVQGRKIDTVMVVVTRHYGGIKLGVGGLVRAYGGCAAKCLQAADLKPVIIRREVRFKVGFDDLGVLYPIIDRFGAEKVGERYTSNGLDMRVRIDQADHRALQTALADASAGRIEVLDK